MSRNEYDYYGERKTVSVNKSKLVIIIVSVIVLIVLGFIIVQRVTVKKESGPAGMGGKGGFSFGGGRTATAVKSVVAQNMTLKSFVNTNGEIQTQNSIDVYPSMGGKVIQMNVSLGASVRKGDILGYIDPSEPGSYYANSPIIAPISGSILTTPVMIGQKVNNSSVITKIGDINNLQITCKIPERYVGELSIGQKAEVRVQAYPDEVYSATVVRISPVVDSLSRTKEIILNFDKRNEHINAGMFANVKLYTIDYSGYPAINQDSFVSVDEDYFLYVINPASSTVEKRAVKRGKSVDGMYQVLEGVAVGDVVVTEGMLTLYDGAKVNDISGNVAPVEDKPADEGGEKGDFGGKVPPAGGKR